MSLQCVIPMAGASKRFFDAGYEHPKYMIEVNNKTLFEWSLSSLPLALIDQFVFVVLKEHEQQFDLKNFIKSKLNKLLTIDKKIDVQLKQLEEQTRGQAETVFLAKERFDMNKELLIYNIDTHFKSKSLSKKILAKDKDDGIIGAFMDSSNNENWSFAVCNDHGVVLKTTEKEKISDYALTGFYHFRKAGNFFDVAEQAIQKNDRTHNEFYIAPMYNELIRKNQRYMIDVVDNFIPLGTPKDIKNQTL